MCRQNRETGENPVRSRRCNGRTLRIYATGNRFSGKARQGVDAKVRKPACCSHPRNDELSGTLKNAGLLCLVSFGANFQVAAWKFFIFIFV